MPFAKWNLEPVFVNRSVHWTGPLKPSPPVLSNSKQPTQVDECKQQLPNGTTLNQKNNNNHENESSIDSSTSLLPPTLSYTPILTRNKQANIQLKCKYKSQENKGDGSVISAASNKSNLDNFNAEEQCNGNDQDQLVDNANEENDVDDGDDDGGGGGEEKEHSNGIKIQNKNLKQTTEAGKQIETQSNSQEQQEVVIEQILLTINNRTLVGIIRQMASLLSISDQMFMEIGEECRRLFERSQQIRSRFVKLSTGIDHLNHQMRHSTPKIDPIEICSRQNIDQSNIPLNRNFLSHINYLYYANYNTSVKNNETISNDNQRKHWKSVKPLDRSLFTVDTRPLSVRDLYARAHAPGDVRLPSMFGSLSFVDRRRLLEQQKNNTCSNKNNNGLLFLLNSNDLDQCHRRCKCHCGQCHRSPLISNNKKNNNDSGNKELCKNDQKGTMINGQRSATGANNKATACKMLSISDYGAGTTSRSCECCENEECISPNESSSSSIVTWSSVTSSTFEPFNTTNANQSTIDKLESATQKCIIKDEINSGSINSSFSSSGDYYPSANVHSTLSACESNNSAMANNTTKTIDDFFRKNEMMIIADDTIAGKNNTINNENKKTMCTCSCTVTIGNDIKNDSLKFSTTDNDKQNDRMEKEQQKESRQLSRQNSSSVTINQPLSSGLSDYWYWWWWADDENRRRWSSALTGSSPLNPTLLDEMTIWLRENIETRRPESIVFKSASDVPNDVLLERALSPPCSSHSITLRKPITNQQTDQLNIDSSRNSGRFSKLKRRWSLFPLRQLSKRFGGKNRLALIEGPKYGNISLEKEDGQPILTKAFHSSHENIHEAIDDWETPKEIILLSPEKRAKLLADQFCDSTIESIDVSGKYFDRLSFTRQSLIHTDFHIPRNKVPGYTRRSRSKSPHHSLSKTAAANINRSAIDNLTVSPYALANINLNKDGTSLMTKTKVTEKGCQTDMDFNMNVFSGLGNNKHLVPVEVHRNHDEFNYHNTLFNNEPAYTTLLKRDHSSAGCQTKFSMNNFDYENLDSPYVFLYKNANYNEKHDNDTMITSSNESINNVVDLGKSPASVGAENNLQENDQSKIMKTGKSSSSLIQQPPNNTIAKSTQTTSETFIEQNPFHNRMLINQYAIVNPKKIFAAKKEVQKKSQQNGARSSSGNWSEATSDLIQSSSSSSSPQLNKSTGNSNMVDTASRNYRLRHNIVDNGNVSIKCNDIGFARQDHHYHHIEKMANKLNQINVTNVNAGNGNNQNTNNNNEEAESVYSVDNDGYYTSMHTDSGLFFSNSLPFDHSHSNNNNNQLRHNYQSFNSPASILLSKLTNNRTGTSTFNSQTSLAKRHSIMNAMNHNNATIDDRFLMNKGEKFASNYRNLLLSRLKRYPNMPNHNRPDNELLEQRKQIESKFGSGCNSMTGANADKDKQNSDTVKNESFPTDSNQLQKKQTKENNNNMGSNLSINSILSNSDAATSTIINDDEEEDRENGCDTNNSYIIDYDRSYQRLSGKSTNIKCRNHQQHDQSEMHKKLNNINRKHRIRSASGTYEEVDDDDNENIHINNLNRNVNDNDDKETTGNNSLSSETLHTYEDYDDEDESQHPVLNKIGALYGEKRLIDNSKGKKSKEQDSFGPSPNIIKCRSTLTPSIMNSSVESNDNGPKRYTSLTESSSNSSSCRKLPPPPPPPRVSSMLRTLQKYGIKRTTYHDDALTSTSSYTSDILSQRTDINADISLTSQSETNSEYLHSHDERHRRLFLDIDSHRSYPPLSYIYDQTDTATTVSVQSSTCFEDDNSQNKNNSDKTIILDQATSSAVNAFDSAIKSSESSQTTTPVPSENDDNLNGENVSPDDEQLSNSVINLNNSNNNCIVTNKKALEERHLSSPLPPPKLDLFTLNNHQQQQQSSLIKFRSKTSFSKESPNISSSLSTIKAATSSSESMPKPKPRISLILSNSSTFSTSISDEENSNLDSSITKRNSIEFYNKTKTNVASNPSNNNKPTSTTMHYSSTLPLSSSTRTNTSRRLTTEDLFIILHNSKKRHNIRTDPPLFPPSNKLSLPNGSDTTNSSGLRSPISPDGKIKSIPSPTTAQEPKLKSNLTNSHKRRSWTDVLTASTTTTNSTTTGARTRQSLALDRLGPVRPTTLNDFKRLLAQVRTSPSPTHNVINGNGSNLKSNGSFQVSSTYTALQQVLNKNSGNLQQQTQSTDTSLKHENQKSCSLSPNSDISLSLSLSPPLSPMSPSLARSISPDNKNEESLSSLPIGSPEQPRSPNSNPSMSNFIKKFKTTKFYPNGPSNRSMMMDVCPPIPEDDSVYINDKSKSINDRYQPKKLELAASENKNSNTNNNNNEDAEKVSLKHNCTSTWV